MGLPCLDTARLTLRPWTVDDVDALHALWTKPDVRRWLWDDVVITRERAKDIVLDAICSAEKSGVGMWCVLLRGQKDAIGFCGFRFMDDTNNIEVMYGLLPEHWGCGLATEAARTVLDYGFASGLFNRVYARTDVANRTSVRVLEQLGMRFEGQTIADDLPLLCYSLSKP